MKQLLLLFLCIILFSATKAQEFRFGINLFPLTASQIKYDKDFLILPDYMSVKLDQSMRPTIRKMYLCGAYFRYNKRHVMIKTELNYFNRFFMLGESLTEAFQSNDPYKITIRYLTIEVPLYVGYTLKPNARFRITPFGGISAELGKMNRLKPPIIAKIDDASNERVYSELWDQSKLMPPTLINYVAGVEFMYYGVLFQLAAKRNATDFFYRSASNANPTSILMLETTLGFGVHKGGFAHTIMKRAK